MARLQKSLSLAGMQDGQADNRIPLIPHDHILVRQLTVCGVAGLLEVDVQGVRLLIVRQPQHTLYDSFTAGSTRKNSPISNTAIVDLSPKGLGAARWGTPVRIQGS